jgi:hypothetical protein
VSTEAAAAMKQVVAEVTPMLKEAGFRKRRHSFNRHAVDGLTGVVHFQMGAYEPPGTVEIPPFRRNLYGRFTINLGIFSPDMPTYGPPGKKYEWINEYDCQLRKRIGHLLPDPRDVWWPLDDLAFAEQIALATLSDHGLPWLDRYPTRISILDAFRRGDRNDLGIGPGGAVGISALLLATGERAEARITLAEYLRRRDLTPAHRRYVIEYAAGQGIDDLDASEPP